MKQHRKRIGQRHNDLAGTCTVNLPVLTFSFRVKSEQLSYVV